MPDHPGGVQTSLCILLSLGYCVIILCLEECDMSKEAFASFCLFTGAQQKLPAVSEGWLVAWGVEGGWVGSQILAVAGLSDRKIQHTVLSQAPMTIPML